MGIIIVLFFWQARSKIIPPSPITSPSGNQPKNIASAPGQYPVHKNISATTFWIGESASGNNDFIANDQSAWDENWETHYGGFDDPRSRSGFYPADFTPKENPFYFALPYNDFDSNGDRKKDVSSVIYWAKEGSWNENQSMLKNQWIKITKDGKSAYAQWEDVGPFGEDDKNYVFGSSAPISDQNNNAGLDLSPALETYLNLSGGNRVDWQFVKTQNVPDGPWKNIITTS